MKLSPQQTEAYDKIMAFMKNDEKRIVLAGYAGTGKSTLAGLVSREIEDTIFCAYTGKAANVLREKGCNASTVHSALYCLISNEDEDIPRFGLNEDSELKSAGLVIIDEYSMLPNDIIADIEGMAKKVLYLGDPFQLPPVNGECGLRPDFFLEEIHRQALESNITRYATDVREGRALSFCEHEDFVYGPKSKFCTEDYDQADQIIVGYNKTRKAWNDRFRQKQGFEGFGFPCRGDKLMCIKNNHEIGLFNGMIGYAENDARKVSFEELSLDFEKFKSLKVWDGPFKDRDEPPKGAYKFLERFDYAYAITCHKSQGSEFDDVLVYNQPIGKNTIEKRRWIYTALTRAKRKVKLVQP